MPKKNNAARGNRYKKKTKEWFVSRGYDCEFTEKLQSIFTKRGMIYIKKDLFGSDGVSMNGHEIIFWNSKSSEDAEKRKKEFTKDACALFNTFKFPPFVKRQVIIWQLRQKEPVVIECEHETTM